MSNSKKMFKKNVIAALDRMDADVFYNNFWWVDDKEYEAVMLLSGEWDFELNDKQIEILEKLKI